MKKALLYLIAAMAMVSCSTTQKITLAEQYPLMYEEKPASIVIMPPINQTTHAEAKDYFYSTLYQPLCEKGYYVYSPYLTMEMFQQESAYDAELFLKGDLSQFRNILGADAAMFTIIKDWRRNNIVGTLTVDIEYILRSTKTGETLYTRGGKISLDKSSGNGILGIIKTAINTATTDKVVAGRQCNAFVLSDMPVGKYSTLYGKDSSMLAGKAYIKASVK